MLSRCATDRIVHFSRTSPDSVGPDLLTQSIHDDNRPLSDCRTRLHFDARAGRHRPLWSYPMRKTDSRRNAAFAAALLACLLGGLLPPSDSLAKPPAPPVVDGTSIDVQDGDSFVLRDDLGNRIRVRISGIDAPEKSQAFADRSRQHLRDLMRDVRIRLEPVKVDVFGRTVARVWILSEDGKAGKDAGLAQIETGMAWHFKRYRSDQHDQDAARYAKAEREARSEGLGLWRDPRPEPPWDFRARGKRDTGEPRPRSAVN